MAEGDDLNKMRIGIDTAGLARYSSRVTIYQIVSMMAFIGLVAAFFLISSRNMFSTGYPLDDAWIHQTYARNLALRGEWAFLPGQPSAGSTSPLWTVLLAMGYILRFPHFLWTFLLGSLCMLALALTGDALFRVYLPWLHSPIPWAALFLVGEWHLAWAAFSGMETLLYALLVLLVMWRITAAQGRGWVIVGLLTGLSVWIRPDGITLFGPAAFCLLFQEVSWGKRLRAMGWLVGGILLLFAPYLLFNLRVQGSIWPNTFYAKQAEYAVQRQFPLILRIFDELKLPLIGSGFFLLPGFLRFGWQALRERRWYVLAAVLWFLGYALVYALRLPVTYQYGRYFMPAMPVYFVTGLAGTVELARLWKSGKVRWLLGRVWMISGLVVWLAFLGIGANRYARDVAFIETEMVSAAKWIAVNTPPGAFVAAHDIGALGYFGDRPLLDLAGLISPEVIPFIRDEGQIARWLDARGAGYLVVFPDWYQHLTDGKPVLYQSSARFSIEDGGTNMRIYDWNP